VTHWTEQETADFIQGGAVTEVCRTHLCERQRVTVAEIVSVRQFLARLEWRPYLRFRGV
jgi:hypothetical protein